MSLDDACCEGMGFVRMHEKILRGLAERLGVLCVLCASA